MTLALPTSRGHTIFVVEFFLGHASSPKLLLCQLDVCSARPTISLRRRFRRRRHLRRRPTNARTNHQILNGLASVSPVPVERTATFLSAMWFPKRGLESPHPNLRNHSALNFVAQTLGAKSVACSRLGSARRLDLS
jgi:hypothetical protein